MNRILSLTLTKRQLTILLMIGMSTVLILTLVLEYVDEYIPCELCLKERNAYYYCLPISILAAILGRNEKFSKLISFLMITISFIMLSNAIIGSFHTGLERGLWSGSKICTLEDTNSNNLTNAKDLFSKIKTSNKKSCNEVQLYILGLSLASWNVITSFFFAIIAFQASRKTLKENF
ncbi:Periplasmic thiol:disulfide oxidoreductase DsbB [Liberibacter crescens BT-1]|uniref:Periplasmic thiol:disulfide oxidoreductase DsbB n=1 Tax=Liberibacter crescens (strain BT-1) TaxID=1215343 RepID=L0EU71_LIBCB|nr:disulfide bond formation protein B [Liberibacter crescens]AGA64208.1 Periplasmic thiol:disulfide oxidoreductase DsbB [Liberibacter crescens BT-1]